MMGSGTIATACTQTLQICLKHTEHQAANGDLIAAVWGDYQTQLRWVTITPVGMRVDSLVGWNQPSVRVVARRDWTVSPGDHSGKQPNPLIIAHFYTSGTKRETFAGSCRAPLLFLSLFPLLFFFLLMQPSPRRRPEPRQTAPFRQEERQGSASEWPR